MMSTTASTCVKGAVGAVLTAAGFRCQRPCRVPVTNDLEGRTEVRENEVESVRDRREGDQEFSFASRSLLVKLVPIIPSSENIQGHSSSKVASMEPPCSATLEADWLLRIQQGSAIGHHLAAS
jgi:hypothetical protein